MKHKDIIILLVSALLLVMAWVAFSVYHNLVESTTPETLEKETLPIKSSFDEPTIKKLKERKQVSPLFQLDNPLPIPTTPSEPSPSPTEENLTPTASPGGQINS